MFQAKRRFDGDLGCEWAKDNSLQEKFDYLSEDCDFYAVRHWFLKCASGPAFEIFFEKESLKEYIDKKVLAGDGIEIWGIIEDQLNYINAKMPDENGLIPIKGCAY